MSNKDLIQQMKGRAKFCRDRGEIKTPELLERASNLLESQETERLKTQLLAAEAEIARLQSALDEVRKFCDGEIDDFDCESLYDQGILCGFRLVVKKINRITGADK